MSEAESNHNDDKEAKVNKTFLTDDEDCKSYFSDDVGKLAIEMSDVLYGKNGDKNNRTPHVCRSACRHYQGDNDFRDGRFREFCWRDGCKKIYNGHYCGQYENKKPKIPEGILEI
jgi:hypothetical protein